ncbi:LPXTG cell wall anchor domain-containing protein [Streptomyces sp. NPDC055254]
MGVLSVGVGVLRWLAAHPWLVVLALLAVAAAGGVWVWRRREAAQ